VRVYEFRRCPTEAFEHYSWLNRPLAVIRRRWQDFQRYDERATDGNGM